MGQHITTKYRRNKKHFVKIYKVVGKWYQHFNAYPNTTQNKQKKQKWKKKNIKTYEYLRFYLYKI